MVRESRNFHENLWVIRGETSTRYDVCEVPLLTRPQTSQTIPFPTSTYLPKPYSFQAYCSVRVSPFPKIPHSCLPSGLGHSPSQSQDNYASQPWKAITLPFYDLSSSISESKDPFMINISDSSQYALYPLNGRLEKSPDLQHIVLPDLYN